MPNAMMFLNSHIRRAVRCLDAGGVLAYATEAVWGLGCDPLDEDACKRLLELKARPVEKGLILIASDFSQLAPYVLPLNPARQQELMASWPGPVTWLLPAQPHTPHWLTGAHDTLAVRVTAHPQVRALCAAFGRAIVSTSANPAGRPPARTAMGVRHYFHGDIDYLLPGETLGRAAPSEIRDGRTGAIIRPA